MNLQTKTRVFSVILKAAVKQKEIRKGNRRNYLGSVPFLNKATTAPGLSLADGKPLVGSMTT